MTALQLGPMLRYVDETSATIWVETNTSGTVEVLGTRTSTFSVHGRHYALAIIEGLAPGTTTEYDVVFNGVRVWPESDSTLPASIVRTAAPTAPVSVLVGSCRAAAPHEPPYTLELPLNADGRGVDAMWVHGQRMITESPEEWPNLLLLVGDQIYADDSSPEAKARIERRRSDTSELPAEIVANYEEYCWLYHEAWSATVERWLLSTVPSAMIFDDHDNIDDWNISASWVHDIGAESWWEEHALSGLMSYWVYQHLGNISPEQIRSEGLLAALSEVDDGTELLRSWARDILEATPTAGGYPFSYARTVGDVTVVVIDCRNGRVLDGDSRLMIGPDEWAWVCEQAQRATGHLILATSVPVFIADGLHDLQVWNERVAEGAWGKWPAKLAERIRRGLDLEDWSAFADSYEQFVGLVDELRAKTTPPTSIVVASGDIHFSYAATVPRPGDSGPEVWQVVSSPIRNALIPPERGVMRATLTRAGRAAGGLLRRVSGAPETRPGIHMRSGPFFANNMAELFYRDAAVSLAIEQAFPGGDDEPRLEIVADIVLQTGPPYTTDTTGNQGP